MAIVSVDSYLFDDEIQASNLSRLLSHLENEPQSTLRRLSHVLRPPVDAPRVVEVLKGASLCVNEFGKSLSSPNEHFVRLSAEIQSLSQIATSFLQNGIYVELDRPLQRRLTKYAAWALCMALAEQPDNKLFLEAVGIEIALSFTTGKPFPNGYANEIRRALGSTPFNQISSSQQFDQSAQYSFNRHLEKAKRNALNLFESLSVQTVATNQSSFESSAKHYLLRNQTYATPNHRRGILDHTCQSKTQLVQSSLRLRERAEQGDDSSTLTILAFCTGLSLELVTTMPLNGLESDEWLMAVDAELGHIKTNLDPLFPNSASPAEPTSKNLRPANKIVVKPLPQFIASLLSVRLNKVPQASTLGELFPNAGTSGKQLTDITSPNSGIVPSTRRFLNSAAPYAIQVGLGRWVTAAVTNDFSIVPGAKPFYAQLEREEIWFASATLFNSMDWGEPVPLETGMTAGSLVSPTRDAVADLFQWMVCKVQASEPGRRCSIDTLLSHHNMYAKYSAAIAILCLASRKAHELRFTAQSLTEGSVFTPLFDKRTGQFPGPLPVPINSVLSQQLHLWHAHCSALDRRLDKIGVAENTRLRIHLKQISDMGPVSLFFLVDENKKPSPLGSLDLTNWWPEPLRFPGNFARSFWQCELHIAGFKSSFIDMYVRHQLIGAETYTSTSNLVLRDCFNDICRVQENILRELCIAPISGLVKG